MTTASPTLSEAWFAKAAFFQRVSGHPRTLENLTAIADAAYHVHARYRDAEALYESWAAARIPADRIPLYIRARITLHEARTVWEPRHAADPDQTTAALAVLAALTPPGPCD